MQFGFQCARNALSRDTARRDLCLRKSCRTRNRKPPCFQHCRRLLLLLFGNRSCRIRKPDTRLFQQHFCNALRQQTGQQIGCRKLTALSQQIAQYFRDRRAVIFRQQIERDRQTLLIYSRQPRQIGALSVRQLQQVFC